MTELRRCQELETWRHRHSERLALAARVRSAVAHVYDLRHAAHRRGEGTLQLCFGCMIYEYCV